MAVKPDPQFGVDQHAGRPADTQASCSTDSERPNADARDSSGRSSCSEASSDALAMALAPEVIKRGDGGDDQVAGQRGGQRDAR